MLRAILFDMDGVLFDSMPAHAHSWAKVCTEFGMRMSPEDAYRWEGATGFSTINWLTQRAWGRDTSEEEVQRIYEAKCREFNKYPEAKKMPGAEETMQKAQAMGLGIFIVTGSGQASLLDRLETNYPGYFTFENVVSSRDVKHGKPSPEPYLKGLEKAGAALNPDGLPLKPEEAVVVENAPLGVRAARAAGIRTIAVNTGPLPDSALTDEDATVLLHTMSELAENFEQVIQNVLAHNP